MNAAESLRVNGCLSGSQHMMWNPSLQKRFVQLHSVSAGKTTVSSVEMHVTWTRIHDVSKRLKLETAYYVIVTSEVIHGLMKCTVGLVFAAIW